MKQMQIRMTPADAERIAAALTREAKATEAADLRANLEAQAARLTHLAARARARDAAHAGT